MQDLVPWEFYHPAGDINKNLNMVTIIYNSFRLRIRESRLEQRNDFFAFLLLRSTAPELPRIVQQPSYHLNVKNLRRTCCHKESSLTKVS